MFLFGDGSVLQGGQAPRGGQSNRAPVRRRSCGRLGRRACLWVQRLTSSLSHSRLCARFAC